MDIINNKQAFKFEVIVNQLPIAYIQYRWLKGDIVLLTTVTHKDYRNQGYAKALAHYVLDYINGQGINSLVYCQFLVQFIENNPAYAHLMR